MSKPIDLTTAVRAAVIAAGSRTALARLLGIKPQAVEQWRYIPHKRVRDVARVTKIPLHVLRPDLYDPPGSENAA